MSTSKKIYIIHAKDADQHLAKLKEILEDLKSEKRIDSYTTIRSNSVEENYFKELRKGDMVILLLTHEVEPHRSSIEKILFNLKHRNSDAKIAEVIIDNITYEPKFIAFPPDLEPIRARENMDVAWDETKSSLKDFFPSRGTHPWKKYLLIILGVIVLVALVTWVIGKFGGEPQADFSYRVLDPVRGDVFSNAEDCYIPCKVFFNNKSSDNTNLRWELQDTTIIDESDPEFVFMNSGTYEMSLIAIDGEKEDKATKTISLKAPPQAAFQIENQGCMAPCEVTFNNTSQNATNFQWTFNGAEVNNSEEKNPGKIEYNNPGIFQVKLIAENEDGIKADIIQQVTIQEDESPFAEFTYNRIGRQNYIYRFTNKSRNADVCSWEIKKGNFIHSVANNCGSFELPLPEKGDYTVKLTAKRTEHPNSEKEIIINVNDFFIPDLRVYDRSILERVMRDHRVDM